MRAIVQRVTSASVTVEGRVVSSIGNGICVLLGICRQDAVSDAEYLSRKILNLRVFDDVAHDKRWAKSVKERELEVLCVSQFTLHAILKGNKPDFHDSMDGAQSRPLFDHCLQLMQQDYRVDKIKTGVFGAMMQVEIVNDGPVTISLDSSGHVDPKAKPDRRQQQQQQQQQQQPAPPSTKDSVTEAASSLDRLQLNEPRCPEDGLETRPGSRMDVWRDRLRICGRILGRESFDCYESVLATLISFVGSSDPRLGATAEEEARVNQWILYGVERLEGLKTFKEGEKTWKELDSYLSSRVFFVGRSLTLADVFLFVSLHPLLSSASFAQRESSLNLTRWFAWMQTQIPGVLPHVVCQKTYLY